MGPLVCRFSPVGPGATIKSVLLPLTPRCPPVCPSPSALSCPFLLSAPPSALPCPLLLTASLVHRALTSQPSILRDGSSATPLVRRAGIALATCNAIDHAGAIRAAAIRNGRWATRRRRHNRHCRHRSSARLPVLVHDELSPASSTSLQHTPLPSSHCCRPPPHYTLAKSSASRTPPRPLPPTLLVSTYRISHCIPFLL